MHPLTENTYTPLHGHTKKNHEFKYFFKSPFSELTIYILCFSPMQFEIVEILNLLYPKCFILFFPEKKVQDHLCNYFA